MNLEHILEKLDGYEAFAEEHRFEIKSRGRKVPLGNHQLLPVYDAVENGLRRFLLAYGTGAGKTNIPLQIIKQLKKKGQRGKTLVIAPYQTILENWDQALLENNGLEASLHRINDLTKKEIPDNADFVVVNYDKLVESGNYHPSLLAYAKDVDLVIVDEAHNVKNKDGKRSKGLQSIIEASKGTPENPGRLIALSASPCPNEPKDLGIQLFMLDPFRYAEYAEQSFIYQNHLQAIWEMRERGQIRFFDRKEVQRFYGLNELVERAPIETSFGKAYQLEYFKQFTNCVQTGEALNALERTSIQAMIHSPEFKGWCREKIKEGTMLNFFSHLRNDDQGEMGDKAIFVSLERVVRSVARELGKKIAVRAIHGDIEDDERTRIQEECKEGKIDVLINQWKCSSEGFSEVAGYKPVAIVPLRSPFDPGTQLQIVGRSYRPGQYAEVEYQEFHPESKELKDRMEEFVRKFAKSEGKRVRASWFPTLFNKDCYLIRKCKEEKNTFVLYQRPCSINDSIMPSDEDDRTSVSSLADYARHLSQGIIVDTREDTKKFGGGTRKSMWFVGKNYETGLKNNIEAMAQDYDRSNILLFTPGKINTFLAQYVSKIKGVIKQSWSIIDLGCDSSAPFSQARLIEQFTNSDKSLDRIVNLDGAEGCVRNAQNYLHKKEWCATVTSENMPGMKPEVAARVRENLASSSLKNLEFRVNNFVSESYGGGYDVIITSQSLQYNDQENNREIEQAVIRINHSLRMGGHYLAALTANHCDTSCTSQKDLESFTKILENYGFEIRVSDMPEGKVGSKRVMAPFYFIHAVKKKEYASDKLKSTKNPPSMYTQKFYVLTGGARPERLGYYCGTKDSKPSPSPTSYYGSDGNLLL